MTGVRVWDLPTRVFHWLLVICVAGSWLTIEFRWMKIHAAFGLALLALILFRIVWGFFGSTTSKFSHFVSSPLSAARYLKKSLAHKSESYVGHNPSGGWMVIGLLVILLFQSISGLYANNDLGFSGPLADSIQKQWSDLFTQSHAISFNIILLCVWVHLIAVFFYVLVKNQGLIKAMLTGKKNSRAYIGNTSLVFCHPFKAVLVLIIILVLMAAVLM